jgi:hypothetical protein
VTEESDFRPSWAPPPPSPPPPPSHPMQLNFFLKLHHILGNIYAKFQPWVRHMVCQLFPGCPLALAIPRSASSLQLASTMVCVSLLAPTPCW